MKHKKITLMALAMSIVLSLSACGSVAETTDADTVNVETTESVEETVESESTEAFVAEEELSTEETAESETDSTETTETVTEQCNETGWYRIKLNDSDAYVSNKYLSDEPVATAVSTSQANKATSTASTQYDSIEDAAIAKFGPNTVVFADGAIFDSSTWQQLGTVNDLDGVDLNNSTIRATDSNMTIVADGYNRAAAEQVWSLMNAERTAAGLNALTWDEDMYNYACARAQEIMTDFSHNGCFLGYGENIHWSLYGEDGNSIHQSWYNSPGHHANYMDADYGSGACAVYVYNGATYAVENFALASSAQTDPYANSQYRESNGETLDLTGPQAEAFDNGNTWTASNGVVVYIQSDGGLSTSGADMDSAMAAFNEYDATHGY